MSVLNRLALPTPLSFLPGLVDPACEHSREPRVKTVKGSQAGWKEPRTRSRAFEEGRAKDGSADFGLHLPGPLLSVLAVHECVRLQEPQFSTGLHAARQIPAGPPLSPCQYLPAHRTAYVLPGQEAQADSHDDSGGSEPATAAGAGLGIRSLPHQLPRGAPPLPLAI